MYILHIVTHIELNIADFNFFMFLDKARKTKANCWILNAIIMSATEFIFTCKICLAVWMAWIACSRWFSKVYIYVSFFFVIYLMTYLASKLQKKFFCFL